MTDTARLCYLIALQDPIRVYCPLACDELDRLFGVDHQKLFELDPFNRYEPRTHGMSFEAAEAASASLRSRYPNDTRYQGGNLAIVSRATLFERLQRSDPCLHDGTVYPTVAEIPLVPSAGKRLISAARAAPVLL